MAELNELTNEKVIAGQDYAVKTVSDLSALQYTFVKLDTNNLCVAAGAGDAAMGVLQNAPLGTASAPAYASVRVLGVSKLLLGGNVSAGDFLKVTTNGVGLTTVTDRDRYCAVALCDASSGDYALVVVQAGNVSHS